MKHNLNICVSKEPKTGGVVSCRNVILREKVMILIPGNTVETLSITELSEGDGSLE